MKHKENTNKGHNHSHGLHAHDHGTISNIKVAFFLNLSFSIIEIIGGLLTNSVAILSDALHDLGDSFSLGLSWYFQKTSKKKRDAKYSYGYRRFSLLGAIINSLVLLLGSFFIISESIKRLVSPEQADAKGMFILAIIGIVVNGVAVLRLKKGSSLNERAVSLHLFEDVLGWVAVLIASIVMMFVDVPILDPLLSLGIACFILFNVYKNIREILKVVLQGTPENVDAEKLDKEINKIKGVCSIHDVHLWTMDGQYNISSMHVVVNSGLSQDDIAKLKQNIKEKLYKLNVQHATLEIEQKNEKDDCKFLDGCGNEN